MLGKNAAYSLRNENIAVHNCQQWPGQFSLALPSTMKVQHYTM